MQQSLYPYQVPRTDHPLGARHCTQHITCLSSLHPGSKSMAQVLQKSFHRSGNWDSDGQVTPWWGMEYMWYCWSREHAKLWSNGSRVRASAIELLIPSPTLMILTSQGCCKTRMGWDISKCSQIFSFVMKHREELIGKSLGGRGSPNKENSWERTGRKTTMVLSTTGEWQEMRSVS